VKKTIRIGSVTKIAKGGLDATESGELGGGEATSPNR
jgi:hypothetical protein